MPKFTQPLIVGWSHGTKPWQSAEDYPVLVDGFPRDADLDRVAAREGWDQPTREVPEWDGCYCRRCFLHDDPGGCLRMEAS